MLYRIRRLWAIPSLLLVAGFIAGCGNNRDVVGNMPGPVQQVVDTPTLSGQNIGQAMLRVTGNRSFIGTGRIPGFYNYGPTEDASNNTFYVNFEVPVNLAGIQRDLGYTPHPVPSTAYPDLVYINVPPLANEAFDRLYFSPTTLLAPFSFKLDANGAVMDESWDAVLVNS